MSTHLWCLFCDIFCDSYVKKTLRGLSLCCISSIHIAMWCLFVKLTGGSFHYEAAMIFRPNLVVTSPQSLRMQYGVSKTPFRYQSVCSDSLSYERNSIIELLICEQALWEILLFLDMRELGTIYAMLLLENTYLRPIILLDWLFVFRFIGIFHFLGQLDLFISLQLMNSN